MSNYETDSIGSDVQHYRADNIRQYLPDVVEVTEAVWTIDAWVNGDVWSWQIYKDLAAMSPVQNLVEVYDDDEALPLDDPDEATRTITELLCLKWFNKEAFTPWKKTMYNCWTTQFVKE